MNPFHESLDDNFRGRRVRAVSNKGEAYEGWVERIHHHDRHVVLRDATNLDADEDVGSVLVAHADAMEVRDSDSRIERVAVDDVEPAPYHAGEFDVDDNRGYIADVRETGFVGSFPTVRERDDGTLEVVAGHKRLWVCRQAGVDEHPVEIVDVDAWEVARRFVADHLPHEGQIDEDGTTASGYYDDVEIEAAIDALFERWGERILELDRVAFNADRLGVLPEDEEQADDPEEVAEESTVDEEPAAEPTVDENTPDDDDVVSIEDVATNVPQVGDIVIDNLREAGLETAADLEDATKSELTSVGRVGESTADRLLDAPDSDGAEDEGDDDEGDSTEQLHQDDAPPTKERILATLEEEGELGASELQTLFEVGSGIYRYLRELDDEGEIESRDDPDDGRRTLYRVSGDEKDDDAEADGTFPRECHCGATLENSFELAVHRTEEHGAPQATLDHLEPGEFEEVVNAADSVGDVVDELGWSTERTIRALGVYGLEGFVGTGDRDISDVNEFEFDSLDERDADVDDGDPDPTAGTADTTGPDAAVDVALEQLGIDERELIDALDGAQKILDVQRELRLDREVVIDLLEELGVRDDLARGRERISPDRAADLVRGAT